MLFIWTIIAEGSKQKITFCQVPEPVAAIKALPSISEEVAPAFMAGEVFFFSPGPKSSVRPKGKYRRIFPIFQSFQRPLHKWIIRCSLTTI